MTFPVGSSAEQDTQPRQSSTDLTKQGTSWREARAYSEKSAPGGLDSPIPALEGLFLTSHCSVKYTSQYMLSGFCISEMLWLAFSLTCDIFDCSSSGGCQYCPSPWLSLNVKSHSVIPLF